MGCFLPCFVTSKHKKSPKRPNTVPSNDLSHGTRETLPNKPIKQEAEKTIEPPIIDSKNEDEEQLNGSIRKNVTFDLNDKTHGEFATEEVEICSVGCEKEREREEGERVKTEESTHNESQALSDSSLSSLFSYPPGHRYHNFTSNESEYSDDSGGGDDRAMVQEEASESLFSLSIESKNQVSASEAGEKEVSSPMKPHIQPDPELKSMGLNNLKQRSEEGSKCTDSMLNPIENLTQSKAAKARTFPPIKDQEKENISPEKEIYLPFSSEEPTFKSLVDGSKQRPSCPKPELSEIAVDTSLSSWLVEFETTPTTRNSPDSVGNSLERENSSRILGDRPIGALVVEKLKQFSESSSSTRSSIKNPGETPIIGTVGSYWSYIGQAMNSDSGSGSSCKAMSSCTGKNKEEKWVKWNFTPFDTRMGEALDRGNAQV